jgi:probable O-glycosylation ligase (exosortase A-associated)
MTNHWTRTPLGQVLFAVAVLCILFLTYSNAPLDFFVATCFIFLLPAGFTNPYVFCLIFFSFSIFRLHEVIPVLYPLRIPYISAILGILSLLINVQLGRLKLYWRPEMTWFLVFFTLVSLGVPLAYDISESYDYWSDTYIKIIIGFFMIVWTVSSERAYKWVISIIVLCGVFLSLKTLYNKMYGYDLVEITRATVGGVLHSVVGDPNDLALTLLFSFSFACSMLIGKPRTLAVRLVGFIGSVIIVAAIFATQSRGGALGLVVVIGYFLTHRMKSKVLIIGFAAVIALFSYTMITSKFTRNEGEVTQGYDESAMGRIHAWETAVNMAVHHPVFGVGLNEFRDNYYNYAVSWQNEEHAVHSSWFGVLAETGFPGLAIFIYCVYCVMRTAYKNIQRIENDRNQHRALKNIYSTVAQGLFAGLISFCITSTFLTQGFTWPFYVFSALTIALAHSIGIILEKAKDDNSG